MSNVSCSFRTGADLVTRVFLLDRDDPGRLIGRLHEPLLVPNGAEREGCVPNIVYSCGAVVHVRHLVIPYAMSDYASSFVTVPLADVPTAMGKV